MHTFTTQTAWKRDSVCEVTTSQGLQLTVSSPPDLGGEPGHWTPEDFLVGAIETCLLQTFLFFAKKKQIGLVAYSSKAEGIVEKTADGLRFTSAKVTVSARAQKQSQVAALVHAMEMAKRYCLLSNAVNFPIAMELDCSADSAD